MSARIYRIGGSNIAGCRSHPICRVVVYIVYVCLLGCNTNAQDRTAQDAMIHGRNVTVAIEKSTCMMIEFDLSEGLDIDASIAKTMSGPTDPVHSSADVWGRPLKITRQGRDVIVLSLGRDGVLLTDDDISTKCSISAEAQPSGGPIGSVRSSPVQAP